MDHKIKQYLIFSLILLLIIGFGIFLIGIELTKPIGYLVITITVIFIIPMITKEIRKFLNTKK